MTAARTTSVPFVQGAMRGLMAPPCVCGNAGRMYCVLLEDFGR